MTEFFAVLAAAALFALFGLLVRTRHSCAGPDSCVRTEGGTGCGACPHAVTTGGDS